MTILTKAKVPVRRPGLVRRQRLLDVVYHSLDSKLILIAAAAGYGKTSLLVDFAHDTELPVCWLALDEDNSDPARLLADVVTSVAQRFPQFGEMTRSALRGGSSAEEVVGVLVNDLVVSVPELFILVLDDFHQVDEPAVGRVVDRLLRLAPDNLRLVIAGRELPSLDLVPLIAKQQVAALVPGDLCFSPSETMALLEQNHNLTMQVADAEALTDQMQGWVTGIILATQRLTRRLVLPFKSTGGELDAIYAYLTQEVLEMQPHHVRDFMLQTSILRWMSPGVCDDLLYRSDAASVLATLEARHLFVERVDGASSPQYRFHPLFREFLLSQLVKWDADRVISLHQRAAEVYSLSGERQEAIRHWLAIGALDEATPHINVLATSLFAGGQHALLAQWYELLGEHARKAPRLELCFAKVLTDRGDYHRALSILLASRESPGGVSSILEIQVQIGYIWYRLGQETQAIEMLQPLVESCPGGHAEAYACRTLGLCLHRQGDSLQAKEYLLQGLAVYKRLGDKFNQGQVLLSLVVVLSSLGETDDVLMYQAQALETLRLLGNLAPLAIALNNSAYAHHCVGEFGRAESLYQEALRAARGSELRRNEALICLGLADLYRDTDRAELAQSSYRQALDLLQGISEPWLSDYARLGMASSLRASGNLARSRGWLDQVSAAADLSVEAMALAERGILLTIEGRLQEGCEALTRAGTMWETQNAFPELAVTCLRLGECCRRQEDERSAVVALERAFQAAGRCSDRDIRVAVEARRHPTLIALAKRRGIARPALRRLDEQMRRVSQACAAAPPAVGAISSAPMLQVFALGKGRVMLGGQEVAADLWVRSAARWLFFYLVDRRKAERPELLARFWPDVAASKSISRLHTALHHARRVVGSERLTYTPAEASYQVEKSSLVWYDVFEFENALAQAHDRPLGRERATWLHRAIDLYSGPYLADTDQDWAFERHSELQLRFLEALCDLGNCYRAEKEYGTAVTWYQRALDEDSFREDIHRRLMETLADDGRRAEALRQYEKCATVLRQELGLEPDPLTRALAQRIREF